jgi:polyferredoxin
LFSLHHCSSASRSIVSVQGVIITTTIIGRSVHWATCPRGRIEICARGGGGGWRRRKRKKESKRKKPLTLVVAWTCLHT